MEKLNSLEDAFKFLLRGIYAAELRTKELLPEISPAVAHPDLWSEIQSLDQCLTKHISALEAVFCSVNTVPGERNNKLVEMLMNDTIETLRNAEITDRRDEFIIKSLLNINEYKIADYSSCHHFAGSIRADFAKETLGRLINEEIELGKHWSALFDSIRHTPKMVA